MVYNIIKIISIFFSAYLSAPLVLVDFSNFFSIWWRV